MTKTVILSDPTYDALCLFFSSPNNLSPSALNECRLAFRSTPPTPSVPAGSLLDSIPKSVQGFGRIMRYEWDWSKGGLTIQTYDDKQGPIGLNGLVIVAFVPRVIRVGSSGSVAIAPYPGNVSSKRRTISISQVPGDFNLQVPFSRTDMDPGIHFEVGAGNARLNAILTPGLPYYVNIKSYDEKDQVSDFRAQFSLPI